jgi:hypothetical protein
MKPVGAYDPARLNGQISACDVMSVDGSHRSVPKKVRPCLFCPFREQTLQRCSPHPRAFSGGKAAANSAAIVPELDASERSVLARRDRNAESAQSLDRIGQQSFAARLINGRLSSIQDHRTKTVPANLDSSGESRGTSAYHCDIVFGWHRN